MLCRVTLLLAVTSLLQSTAADADYQPHALFSLEPLLVYDNYGLHKDMLFNLGASYAPVPELALAGSVGYSAFGLAADVLQNSTGASSQFYGRIFSSEAHAELRLPLGSGATLDLEGGGRNLGIMEKPERVGCQSSKPGNNVFCNNAFVSDYGFFYGAGLTISYGDHAYFMRVSQMPLNNIRNQKVQSLTLGIIF